ncbi:hypothetical protein Y695_00011 [Hydrogenophaga sp. T4]|nr:hypothetical protein Y695_00011 [Hydrogenophaga sp. T4]
MKNLCQRIIDAEEAGECLLDEAHINRIAELTAALPDILRLAQAMRDLDTCNWLDEDPCDSSTLTLAKREARAALVAIAPTA